MSSDHDDIPTRPAAPARGPSPSREPYGETMEEHAVHQAAKQHELQECIDLVLAEHAGKTVSELSVLLGDAVEAAGHPRPPVTWLDAVSGEIADDRRYVTGTHAGGTGL